MMPSMALLIGGAITSTLYPAGTLCNASSASQRGWSYDPLGEALSIINTSHVTYNMSAKGSICSESTQGQLREFPVSSTSVEDAKAARDACDDFCTTAPTCWGCSVDCSQHGKHPAGKSPCRFSAIPACGNLSKWAGLIEGDVTQKVGGQRYCLSRVGGAALELDGCDESDGQRFVRVDSSFTTSDGTLCLQAEDAATGQQPASSVVDLSECDPASKSQQFTLLTSLGEYPPLSPSSSPPLLHIHIGDGRCVAAQHTPPLPSGTIPPTKPPWPHTYLMSLSTLTMQCNSSGWSDPARGVRATDTPRTNVSPLMTNSPRTHMLPLATPPYASRVASRHYLFSPSRAETPPPKSERPQTPPHASQAKFGIVSYELAFFHLPWPSLTSRGLLSPPTAFSHLPWPSLTFPGEVWDRELRLVQRQGRVGGNETDGLRGETSRPGADDDGGGGGERGARLRVSQHRQGV